MKTRNILFVILVSISLIGVVSCSSDSKDENQNEDANVQAVKVIELSETAITRGIDYSANLTANEELYLASATPGRIISISAEVGDKVYPCLLYTSPSPRDVEESRMPSSA